MYNFKDFNINTKRKGFEGDKIKSERLLNREITVYAFEIKDSIKEPGTKYLSMQISINDTKYVVFTQGKALMEDIQQIPEDGFPFKTTIIKQNDLYKFT